MLAARQFRPAAMRESRFAIERFLAGLPLFGELDAKELARIAAGATELDARRGTVLFRRGDVCRGLYVVVFGQVKLVLQTPQGREKVIDLVGPGLSFGEIAVFLDRPHVLTAETLVDSKLVHLSKKTVLAELERTPRFMRGMVASLGRRLLHLLSDMEGYTLRSGTERVISYLLCGLSESENGGRVVVTLPVKKGVIASRLNLTQEHFSRILRELARLGLIEVEGRDVRICDLDGLRACCPGS